MPANKIGYLGSPEAALGGAFCPFYLATAPLFLFAFTVTQKCDLGILMSNPMMHNYHSTTEPQVVST
jgi:hypothetical protein